MRLATDRLILRELVDTDARRLFEIESTPGVGRYLGRYCTTLDEAAAYVRDARAPGVHEFAVVREGALIGRCGMKRGDEAARDAMLWYVFDPAHHGRGYATEAARAVLGLAFGELALHRVWADVDPRNAASVRVADKLGMRKEAHHVENVYIRDEWCDSAIYALLRREWETR